MKSLEQYFKDAVQEEMSAWLKKVSAPNDVQVVGLNLLSMEQRHRREGVKWKAMFTGGAEAEGWVSLDLTGFDMDKRPDA